MLQASETTLPDENSTVPNCYNLYESGEIDNYQCDMDEDGTPDICDADMDGDGVNNPIGILIGENDDCSITEDIVNRPLLWSTENTMSNNTSQTPIGGMV
ncbi:MAG: hypothetical protein H6766_00390 [Candidatus Peribacteria bacterium]|nr:MAG: hypothetical protein H6766_00390 [Candidatus Peribacteria bacterium]